MGEDKHRYDNWLNREFNAEHPNQKWVTQIFLTFKPKKEFFIYP